MELVSYGMPSIYHPYVPPLVHIAVGMFSYQVKML